MLKGRKLWHLFATVFKESDPLEGCFLDSFKEEQTCSIQL